MSEIGDSCCVPSTMAVQLTKPDKNNNTTANVDDGIILPSEQCDVIEDGTDGKSESTGDSDDRRLSSGGDDDGINNDNINNNTVTTETTTVASSASSSSNDEIEVPINNESTINNLNTSTNNVSATDPYKDFSGVDTESFIATTLRNNPKDRTLLLTIEKVLQEFIQNQEQTSYQFQAMNSYERMIVHRVAAFFGLDHNVDKNGQSIIVTKTTNTRIPDFSFQNLIPSDEISNGAIATTNPPNETSTRRIPHRNNKNPTQQTFLTTKPSYEQRANHYSDTREKIPNKINRKQQRFNINHQLQQTHIQPSSHFINTRSNLAQPIYPSASNTYYPQQTIDHDFKQQTGNSSMYNYVPMMSPTSYQHGNGIQLPILLQQQPNGQLQYVFPTHSLQQQQQHQPHQLPSDAQYMPVYRSDVMPQVVDNNPYTQQPFVHLYPTHPYPHTQQTTFIQPAPSFMIPPTNPTSIQYATNQLAALNLQSQSNNSIKSFIQSSSSNGFNQIPNYHQYRQTRPFNTNHTDKHIPPIENDIKATINNSDQISLSGPVQEKD